jgi:hypothetical protein
VAAGDGALLETSGYAWEPWQRVSWHERRKAGIEELGTATGELWETGLGE